MKQLAFPRKEATTLGGRCISDGKPPNGRLVGQFTLSRCMTTSFALEMSPAAV